MTDEVVLEGRLHPVTPWRRAWAVTLAVVLFTFRDLPEWVHAVRSSPWWALAAAAAAVSFAGAAYGFTSWRATSYRLTGDALLYRSGIVFRSSRRYELAHLQEADIHRPLLGRFLGVCALRLAVAGKSSDLAYLGTAQCEVLLEALRARMAGDLSHPEPAGPAAASRTGQPVLLRVRPRTLALSLLLDVHAFLQALALLAGCLVTYWLLQEPVVLFSAAAALGPIWRMTGARWPRWHGWTLSAAPGGFRADFGLFNTRHQTFRHRRTQALILEQPLLWRRRGWVRIHAATAGHVEPQLIAPVATRTEAEALVAALWGPEAVAALHSFRGVPRRARWATPFSRNLSLFSGQAHVSIWEGVFLRSIVRLAPISSVQSVWTEQGPWQRRLGLASVSLHLAGGPPLTAEHRDAEEAKDVAAAVRARNVHALRTQAPSAEGQDGVGLPRSAREAP
ncbi:PH domain-containing protein [Streptomyces sp. MMBL 11-1]|uniref:PH domain-containing protein n=1 Tax=Streptomyces sp. MMBL 11-1 TaxID=3026420 RepID=UPI0023627DB6|nr:PH domain-containing protein [Streptomyces sp. MMBL 11-1]